MNLNNIKQDATSQNIDPNKLDFLLQFASQNQPNSPNQMAHLLLMASQMAKKQNMQFNSTETAMLIEILKKNMNPTEQKQAERIINAISNSPRNKPSEPSQEK